MILQKVRQKHSKLNKSEKPDVPLVYKDKRQVDLDISRVSISKAASAKLEKRIAQVLARNPQLHYYQGFHDVAMHTHNNAQLENLALQQLRDFMGPSLHPTMNILKIVPELLARADPDGIGALFNGAPAYSRRMCGYFALAPVVTLFSHGCDDSQVIAPIIRTVLREGISYVLYLYTALVITHGPKGDDIREKISSNEDISDDDGIEMALQGVDEKLSIENFAELDKLARSLRSQFPMKRLVNFQQISKFSVLKSGKITNNATAVYILGQLEKEQSGHPSSPLQSRTTAVIFAVSAVAIGVLWTKIHR